MAPIDDFGPWLKRRRKALGLTQKTLARQAGCAEVTVRKIEAGDLQPSAPLVTSLAQALDVAAADLPDLVSLARGTNDDFTATARLLRPQRPNNLPAQLTPLIGRSRDITAVRRRLIDDGARLVTLVGPPGVGKTRLALAVAGDVLEQFDDGAFFVRLGPISDPHQVAAAVAQALGLQMSGPNSPELQLRAYLEEKHLLLVLDNFEQVVAAAPLVDDLLRRCPWLHVLVTSRQPLRVRGERQIAVQPLALPASSPAGSVTTAEDMLRYSSVALFADRAEAVMPDSAVDDGNALAVAELCRRLDGLPLAIELVAARVKLLSPAELLQRLHGPWLLSTDGLRDVSARQKTLRGAIGWSYDLLSPAEQTLFRYLSVFVGGFTLEAAELLCGDILSPLLPLTFSPAQVLDGIGSLLDKNLLYREAGLNDEPRCAMLETVREFGLERVKSSQQEEVLRERHANCFLHIIEVVGQANLDPSNVQLLRRSDDDIHNVRIALAWAMEYDVQAAMLLTAVLLSRLRVRGPFAEASLLIDNVFALPDASTHTILRAKVLFMAGMLMLFNGDAGKAQDYAMECLVISQELESAMGEADALLVLGRIAHSGWHDEDAARNYLERAVAGYKTLGNLGGMAHALTVLSEIALVQGDLSIARRLAEESTAIAQQAGLSYSWPLGILGSIAWAERDLERARSIHEEQLAIERPRGSKANLVYALMELGTICTRQGDYTAAHAYLSEALALAKGLNQKQMLRCFVPLAALSRAEGDYKGAIRLHRECLVGIGSDPSLWSSYLLNLGHLAEAGGQHELVVTLLGAVEAVDTMGYRLFPIEWDDYNQLADAARLQLADSHFDAAWTQGREHSFEQVITEAVSILEEVLHVEKQRPPEARHA